jgi:hypothetical protein
MVRARGFEPTPILRLTPSRCVVDWQPEQDQTAERLTKTAMGVKCESLSANLFVSTGLLRRRGKADSGVKLGPICSISPLADADGDRVLPRSISDRTRCETQYRCGVPFRRGVPCRRGVPWGTEAGHGQPAASPSHLRRSPVGTKLLSSTTSKRKIAAVRHPHGATLRHLRLLAYLRKRLESKPNKLLEPAAGRGLAANRLGRKAALGSKAANGVADGCGRHEATAFEPDRRDDTMLHRSILIGLRCSAIAVLDEFKASKRSEHS